MLRDGLPQPVEGRRRAREVDAGQVRVRHRDLADRLPVAGDQVDDARRQPGRLQEPHRVVRGELLRRRRLPDDGVAHQRRSQREVAGDRREVERRDRQHEPLQRTVVEPVPDPRRADRLLAEQLPSERHVEAQEVDELARGVDLGLLHRLALAEHRGGVEGVAPRPGQQVGGAQQHRRAVVVGQVAPQRRGGARGVDRVLDVRRGRLVRRTQDGAVPVRLDDVDRRTRPGPLTAGDRHRQIDVLASQLGQARLQRGTFGTAGCVGPDRFVERDRDRGDGVHGPMLPSGTR